MRNKVYVLTWLEFSSNNVPQISLQLEQFLAENISGRSHREFHICLRLSAAQRMDAETVVLSRRPNYPRIHKSVLLFSACIFCVKVSRNDGSRF